MPKQKKTKKDKAEKISTIDKVVDKVVATKAYFHARLNGYVIPLGPGEFDGAINFNNHCVLTSSLIEQQKIESHRYFGAEIVEISVDRVQEAIGEVKGGTKPRVVANLLAIKK